MEVEYILYVAVFVVVVSFMFISYMVVIDMKKKIVRKKVDKFTEDVGKKVHKKELENMIKYMKRNKKYLSSSLYKMGMNKIDKVRQRI